MAFTIREVKEKIDSLTTMSELDPIVFCQEDGIADSLIQEFNKQRKELKPTQLRKVFHELKAIQRDVLREIKGEEDKKQSFDKPFRKRVMKLMPTMAYATGRGLIPRDFYEVMKMCLEPEKLKTYEDFLRVSEFIEAIMAYHKFRQ